MTGIHLHTGVGHNADGNFSVGKGHYQPLAAHVG